MEWSGSSKGWTPISATTLDNFNKSGAWSQMQWNSGAINLGKSGSFYSGSTFGMPMKMPSIGSVIGQGVKSAAGSLSSPSQAFSATSLPMGIDNDIGLTSGAIKARQLTNQRLDMMQSQGLLPMLPELGYEEDIKSLKIKDDAIVGDLKNFGIAQKSSALKKAAGGYVPGNGLGDNTPAMLNGGEFIMSRQASQKIGYGNLQRMNAGEPATSNANLEELINRLETKLEDVLGKGGSTINIEINSNGQSRETSQAEQGGEAEREKRLARRIKDVVVSVLREEKRLGGMLRE
jgi:hypothetical protein